MALPSASICVVMINGQKNGDRLPLIRQAKLSPNKRLGPTTRCRAVAALRRGNGRQARLNVGTIQISGDHQTLCQKRPDRKR